LFHFTESEMCCGGVNDFSNELGGVDSLRKSHDGHKLEITHE
jgi:hypothetical protein